MEAQNRPDLAPNRPRAPQSEYHSPSGAQKVAKMEARNHSKFGSFSEGPSGGSFFRSRRPKKAAKADFGPNRADSGPPFGPTFGLIWHFLGGLNFRSIFDRFWNLICRGRRQGVGLRNASICRLGRLRQMIRSPITPCSPAECGEFTGCRLCRRPHPKSSLKFDLKCRPPKKCLIRPKVGPNGGPESAQFGLKSALAAFLGLLDLKNEPPEGPSEKASNFERFWDPLGRPQLGSPLGLAQISAF